MNGSMGGSEETDRCKETKQMDRSAAGVGWSGGWVVEWVDGIDRAMDGRMIGQTGGWVGRRLVDEWMNGRTSERTGRTGGQSNGRIVA